MFVPPGVPECVARQNFTGDALVKQHEEPGGFPKLLVGPGSPVNGPKLSPGTRPGEKGVPPDLYLVRKVFVCFRGFPAMINMQTLNSSPDRLPGCPVNRLQEADCPMHRIGFAITWEIA